MEDKKIELEDEFQCDEEELYTQEDIAELLEEVLPKVVCNTNVLQDCFAGVYVASYNAAGAIPATGSITGVNISGNYIHDNSSFAVDGNAVDTIKYGKKGTSISVINNNMSYNYRHFEKSSNLEFFY